MPAYSPFPDIEAICIEAMRAADVCEARVYAALPAEPEFPLVLVERVGGVSPERRRLDRARIQVSAYADTKADARDAADSARLALMGAEATSFPDLNAYVTGVEDELGLQWLPDPETKRPRYLFVVGVIAHHYEGS